MKAVADWRILQNPDIIKALFECLTSVRGSSYF